MKHSFVDYIPESIDDNTLFISLENEIIAHKCCCGCGESIFLPLSPVDWKVTYNGETVSIYPSIGNWGLKCKSHYWIRNSKVEWASSWSKSKIEECITAQREEHENYYGSKTRKSSWSSKVLKLFHQLIS